MRLLLLLGVAVFTLCSRDAMAQTFGEEPTPETVETMVISCKADALEELTQDGERDALRAYVSQLDVQIQSQIEDIESLVSSEVVQPLRDDHYDWMRDRDLYCWEVGRNSSNDLAELECLEAFTSVYYDQRELEISHLQEKQSRPED